jgi:hypothetical protein
MAKIMGGANNKMKGTNYEETMKRLMTDKEWIDLMNDYVQDIIEND